MKSMDRIYYKSGYKYQLSARYVSVLAIHPDEDIITKYLRLYKTGALEILEGYPWDGPSGPTFDSPEFMRGSLEHDALYQLMRMGLLPQKYREYADKRLRLCCIEDGMSPIRVWYVYHAVRLFAKSCASPKNRKVIKTAP